MSSSPVIRKSRLGDEPAWLDAIHARWSGTVVSRGVVHVLADLQALFAEHDGRPAGCLTFAGAGQVLEVVTLDAFLRGQGVAAALMHAVAPKAECIWLVTTNDNRSAQRFFVKLGMTLVAIHRGAIAHARALKPSLPEFGERGVPIEDEYVYEWRPRVESAAFGRSQAGRQGIDASSVRRLAPDDWRLYRYLRIRALGDAPDAFGSTLEAALARADADWVHRLANRDDLELPLVAEVAGVPVGLVWGTIELSDPYTSHLFQMWVVPAFRGRGVGRMLLDAVVDWARRRGATRVLLAVSRGNDDALRLYAAAGFEPTGEASPLRPGSDQVTQTMRLEVNRPVR